MHCTHLICLLEVPGNRQLSPLQVGEDNSELQPVNLRKIQINQCDQTLN